jgi:peptide deformylase
MEEAVSLDAQGDDLLPILLVPDPTLKTKARRVTDADGQIVANLVPSMLRTMYAAPGIGLAAPQVGVSLRVAVIDLAAGEERQPLILVNPEIMGTSAEQAVREEGCLSIPGIYADVSRPAHVSVRYQDLAGVGRTIDADGLFAACLQHEIDHLNGVLFVDHLSALKRNMLLRRLAKERRQKSTV